MFLLVCLIPVVSIFQSPFAFFFRAFDHLPWFSLELAQWKSRCSPYPSEHLGHIIPLAHPMFFLVCGEFLFFLHILNINLIHRVQTCRYSCKLVHNTSPADVYSLHCLLAITATCLKIYERDNSNH